VALEDVAQESGPGSQARVRSRRRWVWAALLPVVIAAAYFAWQVWHTPENAEPLRAVPLTTLPGASRYPSFSPDGNHVAFTWKGQQQHTPYIYVQQMGAARPWGRTTAARNDSARAGPPVGGWTPFWRDLSVAGTNKWGLTPPLGGPERRLAEI